MRIKWFKRAHEKEEDYSRCCFCDQPAAKQITWPTHPTAWEFHVFHITAAYHDECLEAELKKDDEGWSRNHEWAKCIQAELDGESLYDSKKPHIQSAAKFQHEMADKESKTWADLRQML